MPGKFIVLEGIDGCGKDTQLNKLQEFFGQPENITKYGEFVFLQAVDPKTQKGNLIRQAIFGQSFRWNTISEMLLFASDKFELLVDIKKFLEEGKHVVLNRWELSNLAYQIYGKERKELQSFAEFLRDKMDEIVRPDLYIFYDISIAESERRKNMRVAETGEIPNHFDIAKKDFLERVILGYQTEIQKYPHAIINGEQSREEVFKNTLKEIENLLN